MTMLCLLAGIVAGFAAGLFGVGGGLIIVPILLFVFSWQNFDPSIVAHLAIGTSLATIVFTSLSSIRAHHRRDAVDWQVVARMTPGLLLGTVIASWLVAELSGAWLQGVFSLFVLLVAVYMLSGYVPKAERALPGPWGLTGVSTGIGTLSALVGIGGGSLSVPFLHWCTLPMVKAVGTSAALGFPIALAGALGFTWVGWEVTALPEGSLGYVYAPAWLAIVATSLLFAPLGAACAHRLPAVKLKRFFAIFLALVGVKLLMS